MAVSNPPPNTVGTRIRQARRARGWTQDDLAIAVGVSRSAVAQWETDRAGQLRDNLGRIATALEMPVADLLDGNPHLDDLATRSGDELALLRLYRACDPDDRAFLLRTARKLADTKR
jgi:transcriptional regulator with XRE-family HTH domain